MNMIYSIYDIFYQINISITFDYLQGPVPPPYSAQVPQYHYTGEPSASQAAYPVC